MGEDSTDTDCSNHFDLIILGTGIVESVVSCAASKCGKKVLHIDSNDYYGNDHCSIPFEQLVRESKALQDKPSSCSNSIADMSPIDSLTELSSSIKNCCPSYSNRNCNSSTIHPSCLGYLMEKLTETEGTAEVGDSENANIHPAFLGYLPNKSIATMARALYPSNSRLYSVDKICQLVYCSGEAVNVMLEANVDPYLEFNSLEYLYYYKSTSKTGGSLDRLQQWNVPCSKADIFSTTLLELVSKRSLMKFLQYTSDWGRINVEALADISSLNELQLGAGRSLNRPQNKVYKGAGVGVGNVTESNEETNRRLKKTSFVKFMQDEPQSLPLDLQHLIYYALCMQSESLEDAQRQQCGSEDDLSKGTNSVLSAYDGLALLYDHIQSLNKFGKTAFLYPLYGIGEIAQAFCRMSAVWGAVYMLRTQITEVSVTNGGREGKQLTQDKISESTNKGDENSDEVIITVTDSENNKYTCDSFVCHHNYWNNSLKCSDTTIGSGDAMIRPTADEAVTAGPSKFLVYRTSVALNPVLCPQQTVPSSSSSSSAAAAESLVQGRDHHAVGIISPYSVQLQLELPRPTASDPNAVCQFNYSHPYAVHVIQIVSKAQVVPTDNVLLYYATTVSNSVCPCTGTGDAAIATMDSVELSRPEVDLVAKLLMNRIVSMMHQSLFTESSLPGINTNNTSGCNQELFYVTTVKPTYHRPTATHPRIHICGGESRVQTQQSVDINHYFSEARMLFANLYPHDVFMVKPKDLHAGDDDCDSDADGGVNEDSSEAAIDSAAEHKTSSNTTDAADIAAASDTSTTVSSDVSMNVEVTATETVVPPISSLPADVEDEDLEFLLATLKSVS